jgi:succinate-semialdehyde dehydrogenase/glutarate-semialdehyde dehydrogenase
MTLRSIDPATGKIVKEYQVHSIAEANALAEAAHRAHLAWKETGFEERAARLRKLAELLRERKDALAKLAAAEMGKVLKEGVLEAEKCALACEYFAANGAAFLADQPVKTDYQKAYVTFRPMGVILAVMPWNFPFWQVVRGAAPALMAGNGMILKHASNTSGCALQLEQLFKDAGFPPGLFAAALLPGTEASALIGHPKIAAVTLTGSTPAGREVAKIAGSHLKKTVLELGGSDAYIVLPDADIAHAAKMCAAGRLLNAGQSCIAVKRIVVVESVREKFEVALMAEFAAAKFGDPLDPASTLGPVARHDLRDGLHKQVTQSIEKGAKLLVGGKIPDGPGAFYPPTILTHVKAGMPAYNEELFGPAAAIIPAKDEEDAIRIANDSIFGLGGGVFTKDLAKGEQIARERMESGSCFVNAYVRSDPRLPFGGVKASGYGRELSSFGIHEFVNIKSISVA